jgi:hypothetical protein
MSDDVLFSLYEKFSNSTRDSAQDAAHLDALAHWVTAEPNAEDAVEAARDCLFEIAKSPPLFVAAAARWIPNDEHALLGRALLSAVSVRHLATLTMVHYGLSDVPESSATLVAFRLCATSSATAVSLGWVLSLARDFSQSPQAQRSASILLSYLADQFPSTTCQILRADTSAFKDIAAAQQALARLDELESMLAQLPELRELAMTPAMRLVHASFKRGENRDIQRGARERSVFRHIATELHFKYATRTIIEMALGSDIQETSMTMDAHSLSTELPLSEGTDPLYGNLYRLRLAKGLPK